ncbi:hypothetical protein DL89DRAFT_61494 [Linderina pennispora]|uniref:Uncharacterized protein n=1 Tax=Linderina pennispora TaxID=61395 RepID=A0A1Y1W064_9FUNG|nr:uncharacterized protein DL89DRAFT_61494 [Linderina pennispora]ORX66908.1 hypothetical protein DL89DRAFT_61494 [Linderina pennispora]
MLPLHRLCRLTAPCIRQSHPLAEAQSSLVWALAELSVAHAQQLQSAQSVQTPASPASGQQQGAALHWRLWLHRGHAPTDEGGDERDCRCRHQL